MREEYKLIFLTLLVRLGLGTLVIYLATASLVPKIPEAFVALAALCVTVAGLGLSLFHIGRPVRIMNTFANRRSFMSWEAIIAPPLLLCMAALVVLSYLRPESPYLPIPRVLAFILAIAYIFVTGKVYHLRARPSWNTPLVVYEYFASAAILGLLGLSFIFVAAGTMTGALAQAIGIVLIPLLLAESAITFAYRSRAMRVTSTARAAFNAPGTRRIYGFFVLVGLLVPVFLALLLGFGIRVEGPLIIGAFAAFLIGAVLWRILFFRSATLIKITPDIVI